MKLEYDKVAKVPADLAAYLSAANLSRDYWSHVKNHTQQHWLETRAQHALGTKKYNLNIERFVLESKLDDLDLMHPLVPRMHANQGIFLIWSIDLDFDTAWLPYSVAAVAHQGLQHKSEQQMAKSSCANCVEFCIAQLHIDQDYVLIGALKTANWYNQARPGDMRQYYKKFWRLLTNSIFDKKIIAPTGSYIEKLHVELNNKRIPRDAYHKEVMMAAGFKKQSLGLHSNANLRISPDTMVWIHEH